MKLMTGMTKWAVTVQGSGDSQGWAGFYAGQALTQSAARETEQKKKRKKNSFLKVRREENRERDIRWQKDAYGEGMERKGK